MSFNCSRRDDVESVTTTVVDAHAPQVGLAMARSLGDHAVKAIGVIAEPEVGRRGSPPPLVMTHGVWRVRTDRHACFTTKRVAAALSLSIDRSRGRRGLPS